jgi:hypothetical protein
MTEQPSVDDLKAALAKWVEAALDYMRPDLGRFVIEDVDTRWRLNDDGYYRRLPKESLYWDLNGFGDEQIPVELQALPAYQELMKLAEQIPPLNAMHNDIVGTTSNRQRFELYTGLAGAALPPAEAVLAGASFSVEDCCDAVLDRVLTDEWPITDVVYLSGLSLERDCLDLAPGVRLERLTEAEVLAALRYRFLLPDSETFPVFQLHPHTAFGLKRTRVERRVIGEAASWTPVDVDSLTTLSRRLLETLALMIDKPVRVLGEVIPQDRALSLSGAGGGVSYRSYPAARVWQGFHLNDAECERLQELWTRPAMTSQQGKALNLAIRRLSLATLRDQWEDRLLDLYIAAEAFYLTDAGDARDKGELKYRLSLRAAVWSKNSLVGWTPNEVFKHMKQGYDLRSIVVHGGTPEAKDIKVKGQRVQLRDFVLATQEVLRDAFHKAVLQAASGDGRLSIAWEDMILPE